MSLDPKRRVDDVEHQDDADWVENCMLMETVGT